MYEISMANMDCIIHTKPYGQYNIGTDYEVNADIPEVKEPDDVDDSETDGEEDDDADRNAG